jgi:uncharacterized protein YbjT (DUF2867 family)
VSSVVILGGHGKIALRLAGLLRDRGVSVTSVVRNPDHEADLVSRGATPVVLDLEQADAGRIADTLAGHDAVVWSAGAGGGNPARTYAVDRDAAIRSVDAARAAGVRRYVMVSYRGAGPGHGVPQDHPFFPYAEAKAAADEYLRGSGLEWTIVAPGRLTDDPGTGRIDLSEDAPRSDVPRDDVALVLDAVLEMPETVGHMLEFASGDTPVEQALRAAVAG